MLSIHLYKKPFLLLLLAGMVLLGQFIGCNDMQKGQVEFSTDDYQLSVPDFPKKLEWLNTDKKLSLTDFKGKFVLLDFWTYACINCLHVIPDIKRLEVEFPQLVVIGVHSAKFRNEKVLKNIEAAILKYEVAHPVVVDNNYEVWDSYAIRSWPSMVLIDPLGREVSKISGEGTYRRMAPIIKNLTAELEDQNVIDFKRKKFELIEFQADNTILKFPGKITADTASRRLFITDSNHNRIVVANKFGEILQIIGSGEKGNKDGDLLSALFNKPQGIAYDPKTNTLYIADTENHLIRKADLNNNKVTTILGTGEKSRKILFKGEGKDLDLNSPWDIVILNNYLFIAMAGSHQIWQMHIETFFAYAVVGSGKEKLIDGTGAKTSLAQPSGITTDGQHIFFVDSESSSLRQLSYFQYIIAGGSSMATIKTLIGQGLFEFGDIDGDIAAARMQHPIGVLFYDQKLYIADTYNHKIKYYDPEDRKLHTLLGDVSGYRDGDSEQKSLFNEPNGIIFLDGILYITDTNNHLIRTFDPASKKVSTFELRHSLSYK